MEELTIPNQAAIPKNIIIKNTTKRHLPLTYGVLERCARNALRSSRKKRGGLSLGISFFSDSRIKKLNQKYLKTNTSTDVIAFSYSKDNADIAISLDTAKRNARIYKSSLKKEILLYIIHGILHLTGYNDAAPKEKKLMFKKQQEIFNKITQNNKALCSHF